MNKTHGALCIVAGLACGAAMPAWSQATVPSPSRAASQPPASGSPAVQASENTRITNDMRPDKRPVPQVTVPLKRSSTAADASASAAQPARPEVDDEVARCRASQDPRERAACSALTKGRKPLAASARGG
jgi:hypothetical protein